MEPVEADLDVGGQKNGSQSDRVISDTHQEHGRNTGDQASRSKSSVLPGHVTPLSIRAKLRDQGFRERIAAITEQAKDAKAPLLPVHEVLINAFIHPRDPSKPSRISTGVLTGGKPLWAFTVDERGGHGDLYYFAYDTEVRDRWSDGTRVINLMGLVLVKAQIEVAGTTPALKDILRSAVRVFGGYTRFNSAFIHVTAKEMVECMGCIHKTSPHVTPDSMYTSFLLDLLCERRLTPPIDLSDGFEGGSILPAGLPGRLIDYYPKVEFKLPQFCKCTQRTDVHEVSYTELLRERETLLLSWSKDIYFSKDTKRFWKDAVKRYVR